MSRLDFCATIILLAWQLYNFMPFFPVISLFTFPHIFSRPTSFLQKSSCSVSSEKNILNSSVEWSRVEWSGVMLGKLKVYFPKHVLFIINTVIRGAHDNVRTCVISYFQSEVEKFTFPHMFCLLSLRA